jgi:hypothetical protein
MKTITLTDADYDLINETLRMDSESHTMAVEMREAIGAARSRMIERVGEQQESASPPRWLGVDAKTALDTPPVTWSMLATTLEGEGLRKTAEQLVFLCVHIARAAGYFDSRDRGNQHAKAVQESNRTVAKVRKAFGFTQIKSDLSF